jgi:MFS family permease
VGFGIVLPILPLYAKRFHASSLTSTLLIAAFSAASMVASPMWGRLSDRVGRKPVLLISLVGTAVGSLLTGLAGSIALLFVARVLDGASGASIAVAQASVGDLAAPADRPRLFGLLGAAFGVGFVAGPALGSLASLGGARLPFLVAAGLAVLNAAVGLRTIPETRPERASHTTPEPAAGHAAARRSRRPVFDTQVVTLIVVAFAALVAFSGFESTFALFGHRHLGLGIGSAAAVFTAAGAVIVVVEGGLIHPLTTRFGERATLRAGLSLNVVGLALLTFAHSWALAVPALLALTVGQGLVQPSMSSALAARADPVRRGALLGVQQSASALARVVGPALGGLLLGSAVSGRPYLVGAALSALALAVALRPLPVAEPTGVPDVTVG